MKKVFIIIALIFVATSGCLDNGTMKKYDAYIIQYENNSYEYDVKVNTFSEAMDQYNQKNEEYLEAYDRYCTTVSWGAKIAMVNTGNSLNAKERELYSSKQKLKETSAEYELYANEVYNNLDEFETFVIANEDTLEKNGINTVELKSDIRDWKDEIEYNIDICRDIAKT